MLNIILSIFGSRLGQLAVAFAVGWLWSYHETSISYEKKIARDKAAIEAAFAAEIKRQEQAAKEIAADATARAEEDAAAASEMQKIIDDYEKKIGEKPNEITKIVNSPCTIDRDFSSVVMRLDALGRRPAKSTRGSKQFR